MNNHINFCHIAPTAHLGLTEYNGAHLLLAHLVEQDSAYTEFYENLTDGKVKILDNSAFEKFKAGEPMYPSDKLIEMGHKVGANIIVMSDYPKEPAQKTIDAALDLMPKFKAAGFKSFFVPQSEIGGIDDYLQAIDWALDQEDIALIGLSILGCPIALGLNEQRYGAGYNEWYKMQRFLSRWAILEELDACGILDDRAINRFHCLGMVDGPNEIRLLEKYAKYIFSWDSSSAIWAGLNGIAYDDSPTGLMQGKFELEVDFDSSFDDDNQAVMNMCHIDALCCPLRHSL